MIQAKIKALEKLKTDLPKIVLGKVRNYEEEILDLNTEDQLMEGIDSEGKQIEPGYSPLTISIKRAKRQPTNRVTLKDTGAFHRSFEIEYFQDSFAIVADDPKTAKLERKYGADITGLTDENVQETIELVRDGITQDFKDRLL